MVRVIGYLVGIAQDGGRRVHLPGAAQSQLRPDVEAEGKTRFIGRQEAEPGCCSPYGCQRAATSSRAPISSAPSRSRASVQSIARGHTPHEAL
jgi:hypothetical protein